LRGLIGEEGHEGVVLHMRFGFATLMLSGHPTVWDSMVCA
jgi:hypothetical protein